jgi:hypothetical protein
MRFLSAVITGAIVMFVWTWAAHVITVDRLGSPLGTYGTQVLADEAATADELASLLEGEGLYLIPSGTTRLKSVSSRPAGLVVYRTDSKLGQVEQIAIEFATQFAKALLAALLLVIAGLSLYVTRLGFFLLLGLGAGLVTHVPYWNWYGFPLDYSLAAAGIEALGYVLAGIFMAAELSPSALRRRDVRDGEPIAPGVAASAAPASALIIPEPAVTGPVHQPVHTPHADSDNDAPVLPAPESHAAGSDKPDMGASDEAVLQDRAHEEDKTVHLSADGEEGKSAEPEMPHGDESRSDCGQAHRDDARDSSRQQEQAAQPAASMSETPTEPATRGGHPPAGEAQVETHDVETHDVETHDVETHDVETHDVETHEAGTLKRAQPAEPHAQAAEAEHDIKDEPGHTGRDGMNDRAEHKPQAVLVPVPAQTAHH